MSPVAQRPHRTLGRRAALLTAGVVIAALVAAAAGSYLWSTARYHASLDRGAPLAVRAADAEAATRFWPLSARYRTHAIALRGLLMFGRGDILGAYDLLHAEYVREAIAKSFDPELAAAHARVYLAYLQASSRTAHVMHGKEQPNGTILPEDVQHFPKPSGK